MSSTRPVNAEYVCTGRCVTVPAAQEAQELYLAFSDDRWTKRVWKAHAANTDGRRDAMRRLSLTQWKGGSAGDTGLARLHGHLHPPPKSY